jgi:hypothetical protein
MPERLVHYTFVETPIFSRRLRELASTETRGLASGVSRKSGARWPIVRGLHGARKGRVADAKAGRGKSGSFRYIYLYLTHAGRIHLIFLFAKNEQSDLSPAQTEALGKIIASIKREA